MALLGGLLLGVSGSASAEFLTGNDLKARLETPASSDPISSSLGLGYLAGIYDVSTSQAICAPKDVTLGQLSEVALKYMREHPEVLNFSADRIVLTAFKLTWPCSQNSMYAYYFTGNTLQPRLEDWERNSAAESSWVGVGYVVGVHDALDGVSICSPQEVTIGQIAAVALKYMRNHPESLHLLGSVIVGSELSSVWPCKTPPPAKPARKPTPKPAAKPTVQVDSPF